MDEVNELFKATLNEVDRLLTSKSVVGDPIKIGDETLIPLMSLGFGFGAGRGKDTKNGEGGGSGAGAGIRPVAVIVVGKNGQPEVRPITGGFGDALSKIASSVGQAMQSDRNRKKDSKD